MATKNKITEMVEEEAMKAEADNPDEPEPDEPEPEPQPTPEPDEDEAADEEEAPAEEPLSLEAFTAALEAEGKRHADALAAIFRADWAQFEECPLCHLLGVVTPEDPVLDSVTMRCERCRGYGMLITESNVPEHIHRQCPDCNGNGYVAKVEPVQPVTYTQPNGPAPH